MDRFEELFSKYDFSNLDFESVSTKAHQLVKDGFERNNDKAIYSKLLSFIDITSLNFGDSYDSIISFVNKINAFDDNFEILPHPAAICVFPAFVPIVKDNLQENLGCTGEEGTDHLQYYYLMRCTKCGEEYKVNGTNIYEAKFPKCN